MVWGKDASGRTICWIGGGIDILRFEDRVMLFQQFMNSSEDPVCFWVSPVSSVPALDHTSVVSEDEDSMEPASSEDCPHEEFHHNCFCPSDIASAGIPIWEESPGTPAIAKSNADASSQAGVGIPLDIDDFAVTLYFMTDGRGGEGSYPLLNWNDLQWSM